MTVSNIRHPWYDHTGTLSPALAGVWIAQLVLMAGGTPSNAFHVAKLIAADIEADEVERSRFVWRLGDNR